MDMNEMLVDVMSSGTGNVLKHKRLKALLIAAIRVFCV